MPGIGGQQAKVILPRFVAIDGLRAWLAWTVVFSHVVQHALPDAGGARWIQLDLGGEAVNAFIIISGFVVSHLIIERPSGYLPYIVPRFMRLFPAFALSCVLGGLAYQGAHLFADTRWFAAVDAAQYEPMVASLPIHAATHLVMLHGVIPNTLVPFSQYAFNPPGWSVSLEWQFYLVAPAAVWACRKPGRAVVLVAAVIAASLAYHEILKPLWDRPSFLPGAAKFFLIGIACRFAAPVLAGSVKRVAAVCLGIVFTFGWLGSPALAVWGGVYIFILGQGQYASPTDNTFVRILRALLESRVALALAERSYSTYLLHWPLLVIMGTVASRSGIPAGWTMFGMLLLIAPVTVLVQEPVYRYIEVPGRRLGKRLAARLGARRVREVPQETFVGAAPAPDLSMPAPR